MANERRLLLSFLGLLAVSLLAACAVPLWGSGADGARLYALHCAACHGDYGRGGVGVPLALPDFQNSVSDKYLATTIRVGRPGRVMPPFWQMNEGEIQAVVRHVRALGRVRTGPEFSDEPIKGDVQRGKKLFADYCARCHGPDGEGGKGTGLSFSRPRYQPIIAPALNNSGFLAAASDQMIKHTLMYGREGTPMDSFLTKGLSVEDIDDVVSYVRSFQTRPMADAVVLKGAVSAILSRESPYPLEQTLENLRRVITSRGYVIVREQFLENGIVSAGEENYQLRTIYFAGFQMINDGLSLDPRLGLVLPSRITVLEQDDSVRLMINDPVEFGSLFSNTALNEMGQDLHEVYRSILEEAVL